MTGQIPDTYRYNGRKYSIIALTSPIDFNPEDYGFRPKAPTTACWRGYVCEYEITDDQLYLSRFDVYCGDDPYPVFDGVSPVKGRDFRHMMVYRNLHHVIDYDGSIVVGTGFLSKYYIHMGFQRAWAYRNVYELVFQHGKVISRIDHSKAVAKIRKQVDQNPDFSGELYGNLQDFIHDSFSLDKDVKAWWI